MLIYYTKLLAVSSLGGVPQHSIHYEISINKYQLTNKKRGTDTNVYSPDNKLSGFSLFSRHGAHAGIQLEVALALHAID